MNNTTGRFLVMVWGAIIMLFLVLMPNDSLAAVATGRSVTCLVAASDAPANVRANADYVADGTDDQVEIQSCVNRAGRVALAGTFNISAHVKLVSNLELVGLGRQSAYLQAVSSLDAILSDESVALNAVTVRELTLDAGTTNTSTIAIQGARGRQLRVERVRLLNGEAFIDHADDVWLVDNYVNGGTLRCSVCADLRIERNTLQNAGINAGTGLRGIVAGNIIKNYGATAIDIGSSSNMTVANNMAYDVQNCVWTEATAAPSHDLVINGNYCEGRDGVGITLLQVSSVLVKDNRVAGFDWGILVDGPVSRFLITDNLLYGHYTHGLWVRDSATGTVTDGTIRGNVIRDGNTAGAAGRGIWLRGAWNLTIQNNDVEGPYQFGLLEGDGAFPNHLSGNHRIVGNDFRGSGGMQLNGTGGGTVVIRNLGV